MQCKGAVVALYTSPEVASVRKSYPLSSDWSGNHTWISCCSMGRVPDVTPVIIYIELLAVPKFRSRMSLNRDTFSGMAVAVVLMRNLAGCFARWNLFGHNWTFVQTREWSVSQSALWYALVIRMLLWCSRREMMRSSWWQFLDLGCIHENLWCNFTPKNVSVMQRWWWVQSSSRRWPFSLHLPTPKWPRQLGQEPWSFAHSGIEIAKTNQRFILRDVFDNFIKLAVNGIFSVGARS